LLKYYFHTDLVLTVSTAESAHLCVQIRANLSAFIQKLENYMQNPHGYMVKEFACLHVDIRGRESFGQADASMFC